MANQDRNEQKTFQASWGVNPLKQGDETLAVLDGWHDWTFKPARRHRHKTLTAAVVVLLAACVVGASLAWI